MDLLFDFDGTLVDSLHCVLEKTNLLAERFNFRKVQAHEFELIRSLSSHEIIRFLGIPFYKIPSLIFEMRRLLHEEMPQIAPVANMGEILEKFHQAQFTLGILTSNSKKNVLRWLETHHMQHYFKFIHTESSYFSKKYLLKKTLRKYQIDSSKTFYICDETRDIQAAQKNKVKSIAVAWGYNDEKTLSQYQPTYLIQKPEELLALCGL